MNPKKRKPYLDVAVVLLQGIFLALTVLSENFRSTYIFITVMLFEYWVAQFCVAQIYRQNENVAYGVTTLYIFVLWIVGSFVPNLNFALAGALALVWAVIPLAAGIIVYTHELKEAKK